jgi:hypothetical protein
MPAMPITIPKTLKAAPRPMKDTPASRIYSGTTTPKTPKAERVKKLIAYRASMACELLASISIDFTSPDVDHR